jgi:hypothetical protein
LGADITAKLCEDLVTKGPLTNRLGNSRDRNPGIFIRHSFCIRRAKGWQIALEALIMSCFTGRPACRLGIFLLLFLRSRGDKLARLFSLRHLA